MASTKEYGAEVDDQTASTFSLTEEDHTLGNTLRFILNKDPRVSFVGYSIPHQSEERVNLRLQTTGLPARDILKDALQDTMALNGHVRVEFEKAVEEYRAVQGMREMSVGVTGKSGASEKLASLMNPGRPIPNDRV